MTTTPRGTRPATKSQQDLILTLANERPDWQDRLSGLEYERTFDVTTGSGKTMTMPEASAAIRALLAIPKPKKATRGRAGRVTAGTSFKDALAAMRAETPDATEARLKQEQQDMDTEEPAPITAQEWAEGDVLKDRMGNLWVLLRLAPITDGLDLLVMGASGADRARKCTLRVQGRVIRADKATGPEAETARELARDAWRAGARW